MFELIARGPQPRQGWRILLQSGGEYELGRDTEATLPVPWDPHISRRHLRLKIGSEAVEVEKLSQASNPLFVAGEETERCQMRNAECFVLGSTSFHLSEVFDGLSSPSAQPVEEVTFDPKELRKARFRDANNRIDVLSNLPEVIRAAQTESELHHRLVNLILAGVPHAEAAAVVGFDEHGAVRALHWDRRRETAGEFRPSGRLVEDAILKRERTILHVWESHSETKADYTAMAEFDWAFCTPVADAAGENWGLYVAGRLDQPFLAGRTPGSDGVHLQADVKFTELVAEIIDSVQRSNKQERQLSAYRQFLPPTVLSMFGDNMDHELLEPRECDVTVMFCDLRGFSRKSEEAADDLLGLLDRVSRALEVMTHNISKFGGVTADFQGDAALGFWGWPISSDDAILNACRAALGIRLAFEETRAIKDHPLADFEMGIGLAHGNAVAGKIGRKDQVKLTVFGPVVNLSSRLESMTKQLRVPILLDEPTAEIVRAKLDVSEGRTRRLARVLPYGMDKPVLVSELLPSTAQAPELTDAHLKTYEKAVEEFTAGRWEEAHQCLHDIPSNDRAQDFLGVLIAQNGRVAPPDWDGIVRLTGK